MTAPRPDLAPVSSTGADIGVDALQAIGLTEWESKAYLTLLDESPATGYGIAKHSGVARAKIYEVLDSLVDKGAAHVSHGDPKRYAATDPDELLTALRRRANDNLDRAGRALAEYASREESSGFIWDLQGRRAILARARAVIERASSRLLCEIWQAEGRELEESLSQAAARGVEVIVVAYGDIDLPFASVFPHPATDEVTAGLGSRWLVVSADDDEVVAGSVSGGAESRAAWTRHPGLVVPITELVRHDLYKLEMLSKHKDVLEASFGPALSALRDRFGPLR